MKDRNTFLSDTSKIVSILDDSEKGLVVVSKRSKECFDAFKELHHSILDGIDAPEIRSFIKFLDSWKPEEFLKNAKIVQYKDDILTGTTFVFEISGSYLHTRPVIRRAWERYDSAGDQGDQIVAQCLISGEIEPISRIHQKIKGVAGAQSAGASLVSFNDPAFYSYGKEQSFNAPIGKTAEFKYTTVLNHLLADQRSRFRIADSTVVFWAETSDDACENLAFSLINPPSESSEDENSESEQDDLRVKDINTIHLIKDILIKVRNTEPITSETINTDPETKFYILGLSPNNARIAVRFWHQDTFGGFVTGLAHHHLDLEITKGDFGPPFISVYRLLQETLPKNVEKAEVSPILGGLMLNAILNGTEYPIQMYYAILNRVKVERSINFIRAGFIKAYLLRKARTGASSLQENLITMSLNTESMNVPYRLGRLFAVLENVQRDTNKEMGSTINSKYFSSASSTPAVGVPGVA